MSFTRYSALLTIVIFVSSLSPSDCAVVDDGETTIKGMITLDGKLLSEGKIFFHVGNDQFVGAMVKDGKYRVDLVPVGTHIITVEGKDVPKKYSSEKLSGLKVEVRKGLNNIGIILHR